MGLEDMWLKEPVDAEPSWRADCHVCPCEFALHPLDFHSRSPH